MVSIFTERFRNRKKELVPETSDHGMSIRRSSLSLSLFAAIHSIDHETRDICLVFVGYDEVDG